MRHFLLLLFLVSYRCGAQEMYFDNLTSSDGLPQNTVTALLEDRLGFIWIGTRGGLCRFDGRNYAYFPRRKDPTKGPLNNNIQSIAEDREGNIWIGNAHSGGLNLYDPRKNKWTHFAQDSTGRRGPVSWMATSLTITHNGEIWFASSWSLQQVTKDGQGKYHFKAFPIATGAYNRPYLTISDIAEDDNGDIWLATTYGLVRFARESQQMHYGKGQLDNAEPAVVLCLHKDAQGGLWAGLQKGGIAHFKKNEWAPGKVSGGIPGYPSSLLQVPVYDIISDKRGKIHIATGQGLLSHDAAAGTYIHSRHRERDASSLVNDLAYYLLRDRAGNLWIGTERGLSRHFANRHHFYSLNSNTLPAGSGFNDRVVRILADNDGNLWTGAEHSLQRTNRRNGEVTDVPVFDASGAELVGGMADDGKGNIWVALAPWLLKVRKSDLAIERIPVAYIRDLPEKNITNLLIDDDGKIWLGSVSQVLCFNPSNHRWSGITIDYRTYFTGLTKAPGGKMFAADAYFLFEVDKEKMMLLPFQKNGNGYHNKVPYLANTKDICWLDGKIYIAHKDGLAAYDLKQKSWRSWAMEDGLPGETIRALAHDRHGDLWLTGDAGIARLDLNGNIKQFADPQSFPCGEFNSRAVASDENGHIFFGCDNGVVHFDPMNFYDNTFKPAVYFTSFELFNTPLPVAETDTRSLDESINYLKELKLNHSDNVFTVEFAALNYLDAENNRYMHRLVGFDKDWVNDGHRNRVTYTNLSPGRYELQVKAANNDGVWSDKMATLIITVLPPWYATWWAYALYVLAAAMFIGIFIRFRVAQVRKQAKIDAAELKIRTAEAEKKAIAIESLAAIERAKIEEREAMRKKSAQDFHDEAGIKLTRIGLLTKVAKQHSKDEELTSFLSKIEENTQDLSTGMRDFIWVLDPTQDSLSAVLRRLQDFGNKLFEYSDIEFRTTGINDDWQQFILSFEEKRHLILVFKEAMNNSLKHSKASTVILSAFEKGDNVYISLADDGAGFDAGIRKESYGLRNMENRASKIGASFQLLTAPDDGVVVEICLKKNEPATNP